MPFGLPNAPAHFGHILFVVAIACKAALFCILFVLSFKLGSQTDVLRAKAFDFCP